MARVTSTTQIQCVAAFHLTIAYVLIFQPKLLEQQAIVAVVGAAMGLSHTDRFGDPKNRTLTTFLGLMFAWFGITDIVSTGIDQLAYRAHWANQAPIRVVMFFCLVAYPMIFQGSGKSLLNATTLAGSLKSNIIFTWAMFESVAWFWIFTTLREERANALAELERRNRQE